MLQLSRKAVKLCTDNRESTVYCLDDCIKDAERWKMFKMNDNGIYPMAEKLVKEMEKSIEFEGPSCSMYRILKDIIKSLII